LKIPVAIFFWFAIIKRKSIGGGYMDIPALSIAMSMDKVNTNWGIAMMSKALDTAEVTGEALTKMMEASVSPDLGQNIDIRV